MTPSHVVYVKEGLTSNMLNIPVRHSVGSAPKRAGVEGGAEVTVKCNVVKVVSSHDHTDVLGRHMNLAECVLCLCTNALPWSFDVVSDDAPAKELVVVGSSVSKGYCLAGGTCVLTHNVTLSVGAEVSAVPTCDPVLCYGRLPCLLCYCELYIYFFFVEFVAHKT